MRNGRNRSGRRIRRGLPLRTAALLTGLTLLTPPAAATATTVGPDPVPRVGRPSAVADLADAPALTTTTTGRVDGGVLLTTPALSNGDLSGAAIYDNSGNVVYWRPGPYMNLEKITFLGKPALSMWDNSVAGGRFIVLNSAYEQIAAYNATGHFTDGHEFQVSPDGSRVLLLGYDYVTRDLSAYGGKTDAQVIDYFIQEQNVATGAITFQWNTLDHIPLTETQEPLTGDVVDPVHANSLAYDRDGNLLMSARHTSTVYKINRTTGDVMWRFGGKNSDFTFADPADRPSYQHDARRLPDGRLSLFDNGNKENPQVSRGVVYTLDETAKTAKLDEDLQPDPPAFADFAGSSRRTGNGDTLVDYASAGRMAEFDGDGTQVFSAALPQGFWSYRAIRADWQGTPAGPPAATLGRPAADGGRTLSMSWNGATGVDRWRVETGPARRAFTTAKTVAKTGFTTKAEVTPPNGTKVIRVSALDANGKVLGARTVNAD